MKPFDFLNEINYGKKNIIEQSDNPDLAEKIYTPFIVNRGLSYFADTVLFANEMNVHNQCDNKLQFDFYLNTIRKRRRYSKWAKKEQDEHLDIIMSHYGYSYEKARQVISLFNEKQLQQLKKMRFEGGPNGN